LAATDVQEAPRGVPEAPPAGSLGPDALFSACDPDRFSFETTDELDDPARVIGQARASEAIEFGLRMAGDGFNLFALGPNETDRRTLVRKLVDEAAAEAEIPPDLCYVNNFGEGREPRALVLPPGTGRDLADDMEHFSEELRPALRAAFEGEEYQTRTQALQEEAGEEQQEAFEALQEEAEERGLALLRTPGGFVFAPVRDGEPLGPEEVEELPEEERERIQEDIDELQEELQAILRKVPGKQRQVRERIRELNREIARYTVRDLLADLRERYEGLDEVGAYLDAVEEDVAGNVESIMQDRQQNLAAQLAAQNGGGQGQGGQGGGGAMARAGSSPDLQRYRVNVLVDHAEDERAPVVYEEHPTYQNLVGRIEHQPRMGALVTDFTMIRPGALHRAAGGYLILDARRVLLQPYAWQGLKQALETGEIRIESVREALGLISTVSLDPEPIPARAKVVLVGDRLLYYLLCQYDPDFGDLFKVAADFDDRVDRSDEHVEAYGRLVAGLVQDEELRPFDAGAVARVVERSARMAGDAEKLSVRSRGVLDLVREADHWAAEEGADVVSARHVQRAVDEGIHRRDRLRERVQEEIERGTLYIDTEGRKSGQANGLSVLQLGDFAFGRPHRITARTRLGRGEVVDIEREVELGGPIHSKGVMILTGFLRGRYAPEHPLSLQASLVFEQSYGGIEGDSASCAELLTLLSAIADVPLYQGIAVTGSVNQHGEIQPIGGVNEKIEGFFDVCRERGLTGDQGVIIPASNRKHLMLREDVVEAAREGRFHVWPASTVDEAMETLSGLSMGERGGDGAYPEGSVNGRVEDRLVKLAEKRMKFASRES